MRHALTGTPWLFLRRVAVISAAFHVVGCQRGVVTPGNFKSEASTTPSLADWKSGAIDCSAPRPPEPRSARGRRPCVSDAKSHGTCEPSEICMGIPAHMKELARIAGDPFEFGCYQRCDSAPCLANETCWPVVLDPDAARENRSCETIHICIR